LNVTKKIICEDQIGGECKDRSELINENDFIIQIEGNNPNPSSSFPGSPTGTDITVSPGDFVMSEYLSDSFFEGIQTFSSNHPDRFFSDSPPSFIGDCTKTFQIATGTMRVGESKTCSVINPIIIFAPTTTP